MKKLLLAASFIFGGSTFLSFVPDHSLQAEAKQKPLTKTIVKSLKKGTLPKAKGKIGSLRKNVKIKQNTNNYFYDPVQVKETASNDVYVFNSTKVTSEAKVTPNSKLVLITRHYNYYMSDASIKKHLGNKLKLKKAPQIYDASEVSFYKIGKYYVCFDKMSQGYLSYTFVKVGTKKALADDYQMKF